MGRSFLKIIVLITFILLIFGCGGGGGGGSDSETNISPLSNSIGVTCEDSNYKLEKMMSTSFGLPKQISMLPDGRMVLTDPANNRIVMIEDDDTIKVLDDSGYLYPHAVVALPNGTVCFSYGDGRIWIIDPDTKLKELVATLPLPPGLYPWALACDKNGVIYAATSDCSVYRITGTIYRRILKEIPIQEITDMDVSDDDIIYISGFEKVLAYRSNRLEVIADGLNVGPVFIDVSPDGILYINDTSQGLQKYNPTDGTLNKISLYNLSTFGDILSPYPNQVNCHDFQGLFYDYDLITETAYPSYTLIGNSFLLSVENDDSVNIVTPGIYDVLDQYIVNIDQDGILHHRKNLSYKIIRSVSTDYENRLCLFTDEGFKRVDKDEQITNIADNMDITLVSGLIEFSVGPNGLWYIITTDYHDNIQVSRFDENGTFETIPIFFNRESFEGSEGLNASIDVGPDGSIVVVVSATVSRTNEPLYITRMYRADEDGNNLKLVANLDANVGGPIDIALGDNNEIYTFCSFGNFGDPGFICKIDQNNYIRKFVSFQADNPFSLDTGQNGSLWFSASQGIFRVYPK